MKKSAVAIVSESMSKTASDSKSKSVLLPVSKKAYEGFVTRINEVFGSDVFGATMMIKTLDRYLAGEVNVGDELTPLLRLGWEFLRQDVDVAMERSRRARERGRLRRGRRCVAADDGVRSAEKCAAGRAASRADVSLRPRRARCGVLRHPAIGHNQNTATIAGCRTVEEDNDLYAKICSMI